MAKIVLGMGTSHSPRLNTGPEWWPEHAQRNKANGELYDLTGKHVTFDELYHEDNIPAMLVYWARPCAICRTIGIIASGSLSHFVIGEEIDQRSVDAMRDLDEKAVAA